MMKPSNSSSKQHKMTTRKREALSGTKFAFPKQRKEPLTDARHVRNALARFDQVEDVSDKDRAAAFKRIKSAAKRYGVEVNESSWQELKGKARKTASSTRSRTHAKSTKK